jgi:putative transposase
MARRPRLFAAGVLYHVIVRGNQRQKTFTAESDYQAYMERLARYRKKYDYFARLLPDAQPCPSAR